MWILALEAILALSLFIFVIWWTLPRKKKEPSEQLDHKDKEQQ